MGGEFFLAVVVLVLLYECITWTLIKRLEKKTKWELHKDIAYCFEQILEATAYKKSSCRATYLPSHKSSELDVQDMLEKLG